MDELDVLRANRPAPEPTPLERAAAKEQFMDLITDHTQAAAPQAATARRRPTRWLAMAGVAAALALVAVVVGSAGHGPRQLQAQPTAAQQLQRIASTIERSDPYPSGPYSVDSRDVGTGPSPFHQDLTTFTLNTHDTIIEAPPCEPAPDDCVSFLRLSVGTDAPVGGSPAAVRAAIEAKVDEVAATPNIRLSRAALTLQIVGQVLKSPGMAGDTRAELLRIISETADITSTEGVTNAYGLSGTRFRAEVPDGSMELVIDPDDGYILADSFATFVFLGKVEGGPEQSTTSTSYARPVERATLPPKVATLAADMEANLSHDDPEVAPKVCAVGSSSGAPAGIDVPVGLFFVHCSAG